MLPIQGQGRLTMTSNPRIGQLISRKAAEAARAPHRSDSQIIDALGGTSAVARLCRVRPPSVSEWRVSGIPQARRMYLAAIRPDIVSDTDSRYLDSAADQAA